MVPNFEAFMQPVLYALKEGRPLQRDALKSACASYMKLTEADLAERIQSNKKFKVVDRLQWATYYLLKCGLISRPDKATEQITPQGLELLNSGITAITRQYLRVNYPIFAEFENQTRRSAKERASNKAKGRKTKKVKVDKTSPKKNDVTLEEQRPNLFSVPVVEVIEPEEQRSYVEILVSDISAKTELLYEGLAIELREIINDFDTQTFRNFINKLFPKIGYACNFKEVGLNAKFLTSISYSGIISVDELGLQRFLLVASNQITNKIDQIDVQTLAGILNELNMANAIFVITGFFSEEAIEYASKCKQNVVLIDGRRLASLMIKFNIGVKRKHLFEIKDVDEEYLFKQLLE